VKQDSLLKKQACASKDSVDDARRRFLLTAAGVLGGSGALCALMPLMSAWLPSAATRAAGANVRVDVSHLQPGQQITVMWRGKPVWVIRRTEKMLAALRKPNPELRDPDSRVPQQPAYATNAYRSIKPEYLVLIGVCTHLSCTPLYEPIPHASDPAWRGGFYCPCHGSSFDLAGRVVKHVPAPVNLEVPPYRFVSAHLIEIGEEGV
jgi:ubiquinol-cytochrome c reductase iron-sulfur subunit